MEHIYKEHYKRKTATLNGEWQFCIDPDNKGKNDKWFKNFPANERYLNVPGCWNLQQLDLFGYFGIAWYKKEFVCSDCILKLEFGAVSGEAEVYLDGEFLGKHYGGWTAFSFDKKVSQGEHTLILRVDARDNKVDTIPLRDGDWYHYGGIFRSVEISEFNAAYIDSHKISYKLNEELTEAELSLNVSVKNCKAEVFLELLINENSVFNSNVPVENGEIKINGIKLSDIKLWDVGDGNLYTVHIVLPEDDVVERIGFRRIEIKNRKFYLNGKEIFLKGINRHEEHADWGFAVPANINRRDLEIVKDLGCNFVRGSHYPQSQTWIDYLDREGILFWSEIPMWGAGYCDESLSGPLLVERGLNMHREMAEQYYHHPSIVVWGLHNEILTSCDKAYEITKQFTQLLRSIAPDRLITYATNELINDKCLEFVDFISLNYYFGWYDYCGTFELFNSYDGSFEDWKKFIKEDALKLLEQKGQSDKPIVISEFGAAAISGYNNFSYDKWTMQYQSEMLRTIIELALDTEGYCGTLVWQFADIKSDAQLNRARHFNNKGLVDEFRRPKLAYYTIKELYKNIQL